MNEEARLIERLDPRGEVYIALVDEVAEQLRSATTLENRLSEEKFLELCRSIAGASLATVASNTWLLK